MTAVVVLLASTLGKVFQPLFELMATILAGVYAVVPDYTVAIAVLTVAVMLVTAPLTVKSTRSMTAMQKVAPELKKLQQKYKGDRQRLNEEMMALYKEHGVNPAGGCLPLVLQFPVFIVLYDVIRGLTNTIGMHAIYPTGFTTSDLGSHIKYQATKKGFECLQSVCAAPRYLGHSSKLFQSLISHNGGMPSFGMNLADKVLGHHSVAAALPFVALILIAIGLQYLQMRLLNNRNPQAMQANPQAMMMQRYMPIIFAVIYINIPAAVNIYFIVSNLSRIGLQSYTFHTTPKEKPGEVAIGRPGGGGAPKRRSFMERLADAQQKAIEAQQARQRALEAGPSPAGNEPTGPAGAKPPPGNGSRASGGPKTNGRRGAPGGAQAAGGAAGSDGGAKAHPRSKAKRTRKAR